MELKDEKAEIEAKKNLTPKLKKRLSEIEEEMKPLNQFLDDARFHRQQIKKETGMVSFLLVPFLSTSPILMA
jgi:hypothetical protein